LANEKVRKDKNKEVDWDKRKKAQKLSKDVRNAHLG